MSKRRIKWQGVGLIILAGALLGCETTVSTPFAEPEAFASAAFCDQVDREAELVIPEDVMSVLDNDTASEDAIADALLTKAALEVAHGAVSPAECLIDFEKGDALFRSVLAGQQSGLASAGGFKPASDPEILAVQTEITRLWREDQSARGTYVGLSTQETAGPAFWAQRLATAHATRIDAAARAPVKTYVEEYGWLDDERFDEAVSDHAWILVQHADDHPEFQAEMLAAMEPFVERGETSRKNYAYLWDRVAVNTGRKQRYGTQPDWNCDANGKMQLRELEDPDTVNARRAEVGLNSVEEGLAQMERSVCGA